MRSAANKLYDDHKENLRYKYRKSGLNEEQVEQKLQKRLKNEKRAALAVGAAVKKTKHIQKNIPESNLI